MAHSAEILGGFGPTQSALLRLLLRNKAGLTVDQIAAELGVTRTAINQHLTALERDGYIMLANRAPTGGRPSRVFALSERGVELFPKNYDMISLKVLEALVAALGAGKARKILERLGADLGRDLAGKLAGKPLGDKAGEIAKALHDLGFDAHLEATAEESTPVIRAYNCIYHALAQQHPDICALDLALLRKASGASVEHLNCMAKGDNSCRFRLGGR